MAVQTYEFVGHKQIEDFAVEKVNLKRSDVQEYRAQVNRLIEKLEVFLDEHPDTGLVKMLRSGSLAKGTALRTLNDIDVAMYVKESDAPGTEATLLEWLAEKLWKAYPSMERSQFEPRTHVVRVSFRGTGLDVDVAPVYYGGLPDDRGYLFSSETGQKVLTSIPLHIRFIRTRKTAQPIHFRQFVRLVKWWIRSRKNISDDFKCKSFMAELLCAHLADRGLDCADYARALEEFFTYIVRTQLRDRISFGDFYNQGQLPSDRQGPIEIFDPVNPKNNVASGYSDFDRQKIVEEAELALDRILEASLSTTQQRAVECWREVVGPSFMR